MCLVDFIHLRISVTKMSVADHLLTLLTYVPFLSLFPSPLPLPSPLSLSLSLRFSVTSNDKALKVILFHVSKRQTQNVSKNKMFIHSNIRNFTEHIFAS